MGWGGVGWGVTNRAGKCGGMREGRLGLGSHPDSNLQQQQYQSISSWCDMHRGALATRCGARRAAAAGAREAGDSGGRRGHVGTRLVDLRRLRPRRQRDHDVHILQKREPGSGILMRTLCRVQLRTRGTQHAATRPASQPARRRQQPFHCSNCAKIPQQQAHRCKWAALKAAAAAAAAQP